MTVGISLTNGKEAIVITDSQVSGTGRKSDSVQKIGEFKADKYHGVIFGTGNANSILRVIRHPHEFHSQSIEDFAQAIGTHYKTQTDKHERKILEDERRALDQKAALITDEKERESFVARQLNELFVKYDKMREDPSQNRSLFVTTAYNKDKKRIDNFIIDNNGAHHLSLDHIEVGSGDDGANVYFSTKLQGIHIPNLKVPQMLFFCMNAYSISNMNVGVGGVPKVGIINEDETSTLARDKTILLANLSGAYLAEYNKRVSQKDKVLGTFERALEKGRDIKEIVEDSGLDGEIFTRLYVPYSSWQDSANQR